MHAVSDAIAVLHVDDSIVYHHSIIKQYCVYYIGNVSDRMPTSTTYFTQINCFLSLDLNKFLLKAMRNYSISSQFSFITLQGSVCTQVR